MQSPRPVNFGDLLQQIQRACGVQPPRIVIGEPQTVLANAGDKITVSTPTTSASQSAINVNSGPTPRPHKSTSDPVYTYKVKLINLNKKSDVAVVCLNDFMASVTSLLWCDGRAQEGEGSQSRKRKRDESNSDSGSSTGTNRLENEQNVEETYKKLLEKHADAWMLGTHPVGDCGQG